MTEANTEFILLKGMIILRVKLGRRIYLCTVATHPTDSELILLTTPNGVYTVVMKSIEEATACHMLLLENGYYDFTEYEYTN